MSSRGTARLVASLGAVCYLTAGSPALAQPTPGIADRSIHRAWGTADGLPQNSVTSMVQTRDGYLWLGTFGGLVRFDGHAFTIFDPGNTPGLASARIVTLYEGGNGVLWIGTEAGLARLEGGRFTSYTTRDGLPEDGVRGIVEDHRGRLWVSTGKGLSRFDGRGFSRFDLDGLNQGALALADAANGDLWVATWDGAVRLANAETATFIERSDFAQRTVLVGATGRVWLGGPRLASWDGSRFVDVPLPITAGQYGSITALAEDRDGSVWIGTARAGVLRWHDGMVEVYDASEGLSGNFVRSVLVDRDGQLWIGTDVGGLNRLKPRQVYSYQRPGSVEQSLGPIVGDGAGGLWVGATCGGLLHFRNGVFRVYDQKDGLPHNCLWALHRDPDGTLWIGTMGGGLSRLSGGRFETFDQKDGLGNPLVHVIMRDRDGALWVGTNGGVSRFADGRFTNYGPAEGIPHNVLTITQDRSGALWLGGMGGLIRFANGRVTAAYTAAQGLSNNHVRSIYEDAAGVLWIGTYGGGLNRFTDGRFTTYGIEDGLPDVAVSRIIEDDRGNLWMSGNKGVFRVALSQLNAFADGRLSSVTSVAYGIADGMIVDETNGGQPAGWRTADGKFWFPTIKGLVSIDRAPAATPPPVFVERVMVNGAAVAGAAMATLGAGRADAEFHYTAVDLSAAERTRFKYRLVGYDAGWHEAGTRRIAYYTNIPPGRHRFEVVATDGDGGWSATPAQVAFVVTPLWWQRRGVQGLGLVLLLAATGYGVRVVSLRRAKARVAELEREQALERERSRIARDLHDDLGSRLAQIALIAEGAADARSPDRIAGVAREAMRTMDELVWTVNARNDTVESFAEYAAEFAEEHLTLAGVRYRLQIQPDLDRRRLDSDTRRHLFLAFKEAIHNVVKHAGASEVRIGLAIDNRMLVLDIADNGRGLPGDRSGGTGNGLRNMRERMAAAGGALVIASPSGGGTRLVFRAPIGEQPAGT